MSNRELAERLLAMLTKGAEAKQIYEDAQARADRKGCLLVDALPHGTSIDKLLTTIFRARETAMMLVEHGISDKGKSPLAAELAKHIPHNEGVNT
jgi:hypothetical protein